MKLKPFCPNYHILTSSIVLTLNLASLSFKRSCFNGNPKDKTGHFSSLFLFFTAISFLYLYRTTFTFSMQYFIFFFTQNYVNNYCFTATRQKILFDPQFSKMSEKTCPKNASPMNIDIMANFVYRDLYCHVSLL